MGPIWEYHFKYPGIFKSKFGMILLLTFLMDIGLLIGLAAAGEYDNCVPCHGNVANYHGDFSHSAALGSGVVALFPDYGHDDEAWDGNKPHFGVLVDCGNCHNNELPLVHGNDCATCHPIIYDQLGIWQGGCQQGACHTFYHQDSMTAHLPFEATSVASGNDCGQCHYGDYLVPQENCLNCHARYEPEDYTPPVTTSNAREVYDVLPAEIKFSISDNGKVGVGRTFYQLDGGPVTASGKSLLVTTPGAHELKFWSMDQSGNNELGPNYASFSINIDTAPPTTVSNVRSSYHFGAVITLAASDDSSRGVKSTYFSVNSGPVQTGTEVTIPATSKAANDYTLKYWSEDWGGNVESAHVANFTVFGDTTMPITTSDAKTTYYQGAEVVLSATDDNPAGPRTTYYRLNDGPIQVGTRIVVPNTPGNFNYSLTFWSEDWAANVEPSKTVNFNVISGYGTLKLIWGSSDTTGSPCANDPEASASWIVREGGAYGPVVKTGFSTCPGWSGVDAVYVRVAPTPFHVTVLWWDSENGWDDETIFPSVSLMTRGQVVPLRY